LPMLDRLRSAVLGISETLPLPGLPKTVCADVYPFVLLGSIHDCANPKKTNSALLILK
jgi:hypothetical protein